MLFGRSICSLAVSVAPPHAEKPIGRGRDGIQAVRAETGIIQESFEQFVIGTSISVKIAVFGCNNSRQKTNLKTTTYLT